MKIAIITVVVLVLIYVGYRTFLILTLTDNLNGKIEQGAVILDVRTAEEFARGHIDGAINISLGTLRERYIELDTSKTYITTCSHGLRSVKSKAILESRGFKHVFNGGAWIDLEKVMNNTSPQQ